MILSCRLCSGVALTPMVDFGQRPIAHRLLSGPKESEEVFPLALHVCNDCGLVQITQPINPEILYKEFNYNFSSWKPEPHLEAEIDTIMSQGPHASAFDIGCNDGLFLEALNKRGINTTVGLEPNPVPGSAARDRGLTVYESWITPEICAQAISDNGGPFSLVVSRQVIEHVLDLDNFFSCIDILLARDGWLFLDMPDFELGMKTGDCSTVWEEHVSYFSMPVLGAMLHRHGYSAIQHDWYDFSSGALAVLARRSKSEDTNMPSEAARVPDIISLAHSYGRRLASYQAELKDKLAMMRSKGAEIALYGVGVRGCCAVNGLDLSGSIDFAVDDQPERQGKFMPGSRLPIRPSTSLMESDRPLVVLLAVNNENDEKVAAKVHQEVERPISTLTLCSPTDISEALNSFRYAV